MVTAPDLHLSRGTNSKEIFFFLSVKQTNISLLPYMSFLPIMRKAALHGAQVKEVGTQLTCYIFPDTAQVLYSPAL